MTRSTSFPAGIESSYYLHAASSEEKDSGADDGIVYIHVSNHVVIGT